jgi:hypothetical protein
METPSVIEFISFASVDKGKDFGDLCDFTRLSVLYRDRDTKTSVVFTFKEAIVSVNSAHNNPGI